MPASAEIRRDPPKHEADPAVVFVPEVRTARIERGDSLWAISRRTYGEGDRYTAIYDANQDQIRDPDLIYPGQVFVLPIEDTIETPRDEKRG
jgi:nucleoid-associated protein YgaU